MTPKQWNLVVICHEKSATKSEPQKTNPRVNQSQPPSHKLTAFNGQNLSWTHHPYVRSPWLWLEFFHHFILMPWRQLRFVSPGFLQTVRPWKFPKGGVGTSPTKGCVLLKINRDGRNLGGLVDNLLYTYVWYIYIYIYTNMWYIYWYIYIYMW